ncbi:phage tail protein [Lacticaseibacillus paracasei]|uniref:tape measure protein n=1 Tax=Lacticaseibacillus paracasei TaxID=1597 RepID=UPI0021A3D6C8|nr:tape measure protein [Lacticaseibacillus paracasei]MCT2892647.1 phage tail protein [Lacticaseibacillus paracasei]
MSTKIALDLLSASESVKSLTAVVRSSQNAWKAQEAEMKSAGDAVGAAQAKFDGLGKSIDAQQSKIDALKSKQAELKGNTADVAQQYLKYQQQIDVANKQLASMQAQQDRAKQAMDYQKSGLAGLQQEYTAAARANQAYVTRLEAEGNQQEANKAKMEGYKSSITNLNEQLSKQSAELDKIASASGKNSEAWRTQKTRVDETATSLAKAKSSMTGLQTEMDKANPSVFDRIKSHITGTKDEADKTTFSFKKMVGATALGQGIMNAWTSFSGSIKETVTQGVQLAEAGEQATRVWETLGVNDKGAEQLVGQMRDLKGETNLSADQVSVLQKRFYGMTGNVDQTKALTLGVATLADKLRLSGDGASTFAKSLQRAFNNGQLTTGVLTRMENAAPGLGSALAKASGVSETAFNKMVDSGQISSKKLQDMIVKIGGDSKATFNDFGNTAEGATQRLKGAWQGVEATLAKPLVSVQSTGINSIVNVLKSSAVTSLFTSLGKAMADVAQKASNLLNYVAQHQKDIGGIITSLGTIVKIFAGTVWHTIAGIVSSIAQSFGLMGSSASKSTDPLKNTNTALGNIAKNKSGIQTLAKTLLGLWVTTKIVKFTAAVAGAFKGLTALRGIKDFGALSKLSSANGLGGATKVLGSLKLLLTGPGGIVLAVAAAGLAFYEAYKHIKPFHDAVNNVAKTIGNALKPALKAVIAGAQSMWKSIQPILNQIGKLFQTTWDLVVKVIQVAWKAIKPIVDLLVGLMKGSFELIAKVIGGLWKGTWDTVGAVLKAAWSLIKDVLGTGIKVVTDVLKVGLDLLSGNWGKAWSDIKQTLGDVWNGMKKIVGDVFGGIHGVIKSVLGAIGDVWNSAWSGMKSFFGSIWDGIKKAAQDGMNAVINVINGAIGGINWVWKKFTGKNALRKLSHVHFANGGIVTQKMHLVMVNDGTGPDWKELYQLPNGQIGMSQQRNATGLLPEGTRVFNGKETKAIMNMAGVEHYDLGGVIGGVGKFFSGAWDKLEAVGDWLANPIGKVTDLIKSSISGISGGVEMFSNLASGVINKLTGSVVDWFKKQLTKLQDTLGANPGGSGVQRWKPYVIQALKANGFDASAYQVAAWMRVIQRESNGNPKAINLWDSNAKAGIPSMGLVQTIGPTFNAFKFPGHNDVYNGYDDLLAGIHYMKSIYGSGSSAFARVSGPEGYANGGLITRPIHALVGEDGPETILPLTKTSRAWQLLGQAVTNINHNLGNSNQVATDNSGTDDVVKKLDEMIDTFKKLAFVLQIGDDQFYPKVAPKVKQYNDRADRFSAYWKGGTV